MSETSLPYAGTSGHSGTETSRDRAIEADTSGKTSKRQRTVLAMLGDIEIDRTVHAGRGAKGLTVKEVREVTGWHHGVASSVLTNLHIAGRIVRLQEKRDRCHIYVLPEYVEGREVSPYVPNKRNRPEVDTDAIKEAAFARGMQAAMEDPSYAWATEAGHDADAVLAKVQAYLDQRKAIPTAVAWIDDLEAIMKGEHTDG